MTRFTKIVCTLGPASGDSKSIKALIASGMDFARVNFSHGSYDDHKKMIDLVKGLSADKNGIKILQDLPGPKIRIGNINGRMQLKEGSQVRLVNYETDEIGTIPIIYKELVESVSQGSTVLLHDGAIKLRVNETYGNSVLCTVEIGGSIVSHHGVNITGTTQKVSAITKEDIEHIKFGVANDVDYIAVSFVRDADDIKFAKSIISKAGADIPVIAKIEKSEAMDNLDQIIKTSDAVMVARGDLALEIGIENVPLAQKKIIKMANQLEKPVITATQMLYSMVKSKTPTRAEVSDIANAIIDGTDALMLSEESAMGKYPSRAVAVLNKVSSRMEQESDIMARLSNRHNQYYQRFLGPKRSEANKIEVKL